jgi:Fe-S-cluster-containing hydrogenase component 2
MTKTPHLNPEDQSTIERQDFDKLFDVLREKGYQTVGPTVRDNVIVYGELTSVADLPIGYVDEHEKGAYRLRQDGKPSLFGYTLGPHSWKQYLLPASVRLWQMRKQQNAFEIVPEPHTPRRLALIGVRACELNAINIQDRVLNNGAYADPFYRTQREQLFIVAVNCGQASKTCFCASMNTGPKAPAGFDLALTEVLDADRHYFVVETGSDLGTAVLAAVPHQPATAAEAQAAQHIIEQTAAHMGRTLDTHQLKDMLYASADQTHWDVVAARCLACGNCTLVCPTCFCTTVEDVTDLTGDTAERWRRWDSCFSLEYSYVVGGSIRASAKARYRQWLTHKLASWIDQFGTSGCVGCGRCITWCPVGIDITEEAAALRAESTIKFDPKTGRKKKQHENA